MTTSIRWPTLFVVLWVGSDLLNAGLPGAFSFDRAELFLATLVQERQDMATVTPQPGSGNSPDGLEPRAGMPAVERSTAIRRATRPRPPRRPVTVRRHITTGSPPAPDDH